MKTLLQKILLIALVPLMATLGACGGGSSAAGGGAGAAAGASLGGAVIDGKVKNATLTLYSDQAMTTQVGSGTTDATGAFNITLTVTTAPDPVYIKSTGGIDLDTGMPAPTMTFVGNTGGANKLTTFNVTPLTSAVFTKVKNGSTLSNAQTSMQNSLGLASNTGTNGLYSDPTAAANTTLKAAVFKQLAAGTMGSTLAAGTYDFYMIALAEDDLMTTTATTKATITRIADFTNANAKNRGIYNVFRMTVNANGNITGTGSGTTFSGKVQGSAMLLDDTGTDAATGNTVISRVVGKIGVNGSVSGNFSFVIPATGTMSKGVFVGSFVPAAGVTQTALNTFFSNYYTPGATSGQFHFVGRSIFTAAGFNGGPPRVTFGTSAFTALNATTRAITMSDLTASIDAGSVVATMAGGGTTMTLKFCGAQYIQDPTTSKPTNLIISEYQIPSNTGTYVPCSTTSTTETGAADLVYTITAVGSRRGVGVSVGKFHPATTTANTAGYITDISDDYFDKIGSLAPATFAVGVNDVTVANIDADMPGQTRQAALAAGIMPSSAQSGGITIPAGTNTTNGFWDKNSATPAPELFVFQGSIVAMKSDVAVAAAGTNNNDFADNFIATAAGGDHLRVVEFYESGAMQGEEIGGGNLPRSGKLARNFPETFIGFVHKQGSIAPSMIGTRNFLARTIYAQNFAQFTNSYVSGSINVTKAPTAAATGTATATVTPHGGTASTVTLTIDKIAAGTFGVYHMHGAMGTLYLDITWPVGGTKALYAVSDNANGAGNITEVGEAFLTL